MQAVYIFLHMIFVPMYIDILLKDTHFVRHLLRQPLAQFVLEESDSCLVFHADISVSYKNVIAAVQASDYYAYSEEFELYGF